MGLGKRPIVDSTNWRLKVWYGVLIFILAVFVGRLFYLQIIKHDYYRSTALQSQLKEYNIPAERGLIMAYDSDREVPLVLNQKFYTLFGDPSLVKDVVATAKALAGIMNAKPAAYEEALRTPNTRYVVLAQKITATQKSKIMSLKLPGVGTQDQDYRLYPQGKLAAQLLGFVDADGKGRYGIEQALNELLAGRPGKLKAITDAAGVPLPASKDNVQVSPQNGSDVVLTVNLSMQKQLEDILHAGMLRTRSDSGGAIIMDPRDGTIKAMANWPTYNPAEYFKVTNQKLFNNACVADPLEIGSTMKPLTAAAAIDSGAVNARGVYEDPGSWTLDKHKITNVESAGPAGSRKVADIIDFSINTGATWMLMRMGGQTGVVNKQARERWHNYMVNHFRFSKPTGIEQGYEAEGFMPEPNKGDARQLTFANASFGQAMTATPLQLAAAFSSVINGGTYYQPRLVDRIISPDGQSNLKASKIIAKNVVKNKTTRDIRWLLANNIENDAKRGFTNLKFPEGYEVGGKTGTAQIAKASGGYYDDRFNGMYAGFVGGATPQYVIVVRADQPKIGGYAGTVAGQSIFADIAHMLINNFNVTPR